MDCVGPGGQGPCVDDGMLSLDNFISIRQLVEAGYSDCRADGAWCCGLVLG